MSEIKTDMKWDNFFDAVGIFKASDDARALFPGIKNPEPTNPPYPTSQEGQHAEQSADTNTKKENSSPTKTDPQKGE